MTFWKRDSKESVGQAFQKREEGMNGKRGDLLRQQGCSYDNVINGICVIIHLSKTRIYRTPRVNLI